MANLPMHRLGVPNEIAAAVLGVCPRRASFISDASQVIGGGYCAT
jgi:hypothetical protein